MSQSIQNPEKILNRLDWTVIRRLDGLLQGDYRTLFTGFGLDLAELREYQLSDDVRYIDWNVTARLSTPYVRQYLEDREVTAWFLLDLSQSLSFGTALTLKRDLLVELFSLLARLLTRHGNRVGAIFYSGKVDKIIPAGSSKLHVLRLINDLLNQPKPAHLLTTDLGSLLETALGVIKRRSYIFLISDFISTPGWDRAFSMLARRHEVLPIRLHDPREAELPDIGITYFQDTETGQQIYVDTHDRKFRARFTEAAGRREHQLKLIFQRNGVDLLEISTEDDLVREIMRFALMRKQRKATPASFVKNPDKKAGYPPAGAVKGAEN